MQQGGACRRITGRKRSDYNGYTDRQRAGTEAKCCSYEFRSSALSGGKADSIADGITLAAEIIDSGKALAKLDEYREMSTALSA
jgi:hypothetical protein